MTILLVMALSWHDSMAQSSLTDTIQGRGKDLTVSLITCYPGEEIYELCGHSAVRIRGEQIDSVWNFGIFDFNQPNFVYRFVKGETDYRGAGYPFRWFLPEYIETGRKVVEQDINFTPEEAQRMLEILRTAVLPENAVYRYNYIKDNCSTRILTHLDSASTVEIIYPDSVRYGSFRNEMRAYHENYPWYQFGIDLALGSGLDKSTNAREEMFVPVEMMRDAASAKFADGRPFIKATRVLNEGNESAVLPPTPWGLNPVFWAWIVAAGLLAAVAWQILKWRIYPPLYIAWFLLLGLVGCLLFFLVFISVHESTSPNVLILWLNPCQFLFVVSAGTRRLRILARTMAWYNIGVVGGLLIITPWLDQSFNPAFYPLMIATVAMGAAYAIISNNSSYKKR
ncbi:MAG: DUF4105 domain-containing protein [Muribaculaceae bacterium]|nr:DUF4105 domain-containing protein [Muribaculaceae bacterium]